MGWEKAAEIVWGAYTANTLGWEKPTYPDNLEKYAQFMDAPVFYAVQLLKRINELEEILEEQYK